MVLGFQETRMEDLARRTLAVHRDMHGQEQA
jgi:hypothetical protein